MKPCVLQQQGVRGVPTYESISSDDFEKRMNATVTRAQYWQLQHIAAGLRRHPDLDSLADSVPETEDLMDQQDDAPIIRPSMRCCLKLPPSAHGTSICRNTKAPGFRVDEPKEIITPKRQFRHRYWPSYQSGWPSLISPKNASSGWPY
jgi:general secretion pathway protein E